jgi:hypothetical protein
VGPVVRYPKGHPADPHNEGFGCAFIPPSASPVRLVWVVAVCAHEHGVKVAARSALAPVARCPCGENVSAASTKVTNAGVAIPAVGGEVGGKGNSTCHCTLAGPEIANEDTAEVLAGCVGALTELHSKLVAATRQGVGAAD